MLMDGKVVLARHRAGALTYHLLPGGGVNYRETIEDALVREIREETGLSARIGKPLFVSDTIDPRGPRHVVNLTFLAHVVGGEITTTPADPRVEAVDLVSPSDLSELDLRPPMASALVDAITQGLDTFQACYLGSLFTANR
jgi:ADP-ribose pyrophosphatase YjhB (NUDIX family)